MGIDADYAMSRAYQAQSWPTFLVIDATGVIKFHGFDSDRNLGGVRRCLQQILTTTPKDPNQLLQDGIAFPADALAARSAHRDRWPRLCISRDGNPVIVYTSNRDGTNAVYLRRYNQSGEPAGDERLSPAGMEAYNADATLDSQGNLWVAWCGRTNRFYDIFVQSRAGSEAQTEQLSSSDDDAMSPKLATGPAGAVTVTYYKWAKMNGISRDRNIFARTVDPARHTWGLETEISPPRPEVEDHSDPDVVVDRQGAAWVVWSFDYHPSLYPKPLPAGQPTIFAARFASNTVSSPILVGASGQYRWAIDFFPSAALDQAGKLWCAWDCSEPRRCIRLARLNDTGEGFTPVSSFGQNVTCSTPELSVAGDALLLAWSQRAATGGQWQGKVALLKNGVPAAETMLNEDKDVLFPQAQLGSDGRYWVTFETSDAKGTKIVVRGLPGLKR